MDQKSPLTSDAAGIKYASPKIESDCRFGKWRFGSWVFFSHKREITIGVFRNEFWRPLWRRCSLKIDLCD